MLNCVFLSFLLVRPDKQKGEKTQNCVFSTSLQNNEVYRYILCSFVVISWRKDKDFFILRQNEMAQISHLTLLSLYRPINLSICQF